MIRVIVLLLILAALVILAVQNLATSVALVILGGRTAEIPFGLLLVGAVGVGVLVSLVLYGLVGLRRSPESKYRPMGRRVPYPDSSGDTARPPYQPTATYSGGSSAFVTEPPVARQDSVPGSGTANSEAPQDTAYRPSSPSPDARQTPPEKKKTFHPNESDRYSRIGDDWGELRTAAQRDSWDEGGNAGASSSQRGLFDFIRPGGGGNNADQLSDDIGTGWDEGPARPDYPSDYDDSGYDDGLDRGWEGFESYDEAPPPLEDPAYERRVYRDGLYDADDVPGEADYADDRQPGEIGPDGVYEADYRVIVPPSKPLEDGEDEDAEYYS